MLLAPIAIERLTRLRGLLASMNQPDGLADPANPLIPFGSIRSTASRALRDSRRYDRRRSGRLWLAAPPLPHQPRVFRRYRRHRRCVPGGSLSSCGRRASGDLRLLQRLRCPGRSLGLDAPAQPAARRRLCQLHRPHGAPDPGGGCAVQGGRWLPRRQGPRARCRGSATTALHARHLCRRPEAGRQAHLIAAGRHTPCLALQQSSEPCRRSARSPAGLAAAACRPALLSLSAPVAGVRGSGGYAPSRSGAHCNAGRDRGP